MESIGVDVRFWGMKIIPIRFYRAGRRYEVKRVAMQFERKDGGKQFLCFAVDTGVNMAELLMDRQDLSWKIKEVLPA